MKSLFKNLLYKYFGETKIFEWIIWGAVFLQILIIVFWIWAVFHFVFVVIPKLTS